MRQANRLETARLVPNHRENVAKCPSINKTKRGGQKLLRRPYEKMAVIRRHIRNGESRELCFAHGRVVKRYLVRANLAFDFLHVPGWINDDRAKAAFGRRQDGCGLQRLVLCSPFGSSRAALGGSSSGDLLGPERGVHRLGDGRPQASFGRRCLRRARLGEVFLRRGFASALKVGLARPGKFLIAICLRAAQASLGDGFGFQLPSLGKLNS